MLYLWTGKLLIKSTVIVQPSCQPPPPLAWFFPWCLLRVASSVFLYNQVDLVSQKRTDVFALCRKLKKNTISNPQLPIYTCMQDKLVHKINCIYPHFKGNCIEPIKFIQIKFLDVLIMWPWCELFVPEALYFCESLAANNY